MKNRERELKFESAVSYEEAVQYVQSRFPDVSPIVASGKDLFWDCPNVDFIRLRPMFDYQGELTIKKTDKGSIADRLEINVTVEFAEAKLFLMTVFGNPSLTLHKEYHVFLCPGEIAISVYKVNQATGREVYIEVEAPTLAAVYKTLPLISECLGEVINKSLYQIYKEKYYEGRHD